MNPDTQSAIDRKENFEDVAVNVGQKRRRIHSTSQRKRRTSSIAVSNGLSVRLRRVVLLRRHSDWQRKTRRRLRKAGGEQAQDGDSWFCMSATMRRRRIV